MDIIYKSIDDLRAYELNAKIHEQSQIEQIANSIKEFGFVQPVVVDKNNVIVIGHGRVEALKQLGYKEAPCVCVDNLTEDQVKALRLADNKTNESEWDTELLAVDLSGISFDMTQFGFDGFMDFEEAEDEDAEEDDFNIEESIPIEPKAKLGDIYELGKHRLLCGDSTDKAMVEDFMQGTKADLLLTDPPYNVAYESSDGKTIQNDNMSDAAFYKFLNAAFSTADSVLKEGGAYYIWHADSEGLNFRAACKNAGWKVRQCLIWNKNSLVLGRQDYQWKHEPCLYGWKDGAAHYFVDDRTQTTVFEDKGIDLKKLKKDEMLKLLQEIFADKISATVINEDKPSRSELHPTMKPIKLLARQIKNSSRQDEIVLDLFGGSGSTLIACEQLNRKCYMVEYDPKYVDVIIDRWETLTGEKAKKLNAVAV